MDSHPILEGWLERPVHRNVQSLELVGEVRREGDVVVLTDDVQRNFVLNLRWLL